MRFTIALVPTMAVNIEVMRPIIRVTENPFTGPEPMVNNTRATRNVVRLASRIVVKARS